MLKSMQFREQAQAELAKAKTIAEAAQAAGREMTADEATTFKAHYDAAMAANEQKKAAEADEAVLSQAKALSDELGLLPGTAGDLDAQAEVVAPRKGGKSLGATVVESAQYKSIIGQFRGADEHGLPRIPEKARIESAPISFKALITGGGATSGAPFIQREQTGILESLGRRPLSIRDLVAVRRTGSDAIEYVAQTSHTNAAAPVPEATSAAGPTYTANTTTGAVTVTLDPNGGYKPEGAWAYERRTATVKTIAEWVPATKRALADVAQLEGLINDELVADLAEAEEAQILSGSGAGENLTGILNTSGIQTQARGTDDIFAAVRRAITRARTTGRVAPSAVVLNPVQVEQIDLTREGGTTGAYFGAGPQAFGVRTLWGVPIVESEAMPAGTGLVGDFTKAVLWDREQATVTMTDSHADFFIRNLVAILAEERVAFAVTRPSAFVTVTGL